MRGRRCVWLLIIFGGLCSLAAQSAAHDQFLGTWIGTWDGAGSGGFELTLEKDDNGVLRGKVSVTGEPTYKTTFRTLSFEGSKMSAAYDFPPDDRGEVMLGASFDGNAATGTWTLREKADATKVVASGTWKVTKK